MDNPKNLTLRYFCYCICKGTSYYVVITYYNCILTNFCESVFLSPLYSPYFSKNSLLDAGLMPNYLNLCLPLCDSLFYFSILFIIIIIYYYFYMKTPITIKTSGILMFNPEKEFGLSSVLFLIGHLFFF